MKRFKIEAVVLADDEGEVKDFLEDGFGPVGVESHSIIESEDIPEEDEEDEDDIIDEGEDGAVV